jgi:Ca2+-binding RTX toxin-like protein
VTISVDDAGTDGVANDASATVTLGSSINIVTGSDGQDTVVLGTGTSTVNLGAAVDTFQSVTANLTGFNTLGGGDGTDVLEMTNASTVVDNDFTGKTSIETLLLSNNANSVTLGSKAVATGIVTVTGGSTTDAITLDSGYTGSITITSGGGTDTITLTNSSATVAFTGGAAIDTVLAGSGTLTIDDAAGGADVITMSSGTVNVVAGAAADVLVISNGELTSADTFTGGAGTDVIRIDNATTLVDADLANVTTTETLDAATSNVALNATLGTNAGTSGLLDIDGSGQDDTINGSSQTDATLDFDIDAGAGDDILTGGAGDDNIAGDAGADTITGGAGADTLIGGAGADTYVFASTALLNGDDTITFVQADDKFDFSAFLSGGSTENNTVVVQDDGTDDIQLNNKVIFIDEATANAADSNTAAEVAALIEGIGDAMELSSGGKGIVIISDDAGANDVASIWFVDDTVGATAGTIAADDVSLVAQTAAAIDLDTFANGNFIF